MALTGFRTTAARFAGSIMVSTDPGAHAPGFMLTPAPQAQEKASYFLDGG